MKNSVWKGHRETRFLYTSKKIKRYKTNPNLRKFYDKTKQNKKTLTNTLDKPQYEF